MLTISSISPRVEDNIRLDFLTTEGLVGEVEISKKHNQIGVWNLQIFPDFRGRGYGNLLAIELVEMIKNYFWDFERMYLYVFPDNEKAIKSYKKAGLLINQDVNEYAKLFTHPIILMEMLL